jgi:hypothetical protein
MFDDSSGLFWESLPRASPGWLVFFSTGCLFARGFERLEYSDLEQSNYVFPLTLKLI